MQLGRFATYTKLSKQTRLCSSGNLEDVLGEIVEITVGVGVVEALSESVDEDSGVWALDLNSRV